MLGMQSENSVPSLTRRDPIGVQLLTFIDNMLQLSLRTTSNCPFQIGWEIFGDMLGCEEAGVA